MTAACEERDVISSAVRSPRSRSLEHNRAETLFGDFESQPRSASATFSASRDSIKPLMSFEEGYEMMGIWEGMNDSERTCVCNTLGSSISSSVTISELSSGMASQSS